MGNEHGVEPDLQCRVDVTARAISNHPAVGLHNFELLDHSRVSVRVLFDHDFDRVEIGKQAGPLNFRHLLRLLAFGKQDQAVMFRKIRQRFRNTFENMRRRAFQFRDDALEFPPRFRAVPCCRRASGRFLRANDESCEHRSRAGGYCGARSR